MNFSSVSNLIDKVVECQARSTTLKSPSLYIHVASTDPLQFHDASKVSLAVDRDDLETYLSNKEAIQQGSIVCLENCEVSLDYGANNDVTACEIQSKNITINFGNQKQKKVKNFVLKVSVESKSEIPILPSTRRYLRRIQKTELARKHNNKPNKIDYGSFIKIQKKQKEKEQAKSQAPFVLDTESHNILRKLVNFVDKEDLMRVAIKHPLRSKDSKKVIRMMAVPNEDTDDQSLVVHKKTYARNSIQQLFMEYEARETK